MHRASLAICCVFPTLVAVAALAAENERSLGVREGVILLTNGEIVAGTIIPAGDRYDVHLATGEIRLRRSEVALVCRDAHECYLHKRGEIDAGNASDHLALAEWCIRNAMLAEGEHELAAARAADPTHPKVKLVESRLALAKAPPPASLSESVEQPVSHSPMDSVARNLPPGTMESFTGTIQPLLLNYCSKGGCHSSRNDGGLKLERIHPKLSGRSATQRNLQRVLTLVNRHDPPNSALLQAPIRAHGTIQAPIFTDRQQSQYRQLVQWVYLVAGAKQPVERPTLEERTAPLLQAVPGATGATPPLEPAPADPGGLPTDGALPEGSMPDESTLPGMLPAAEEDLEAPSQSLPPPGTGAVLERRIQRGAKVTPSFVPRDEFDPEIFNRRFFGG